ncbi:hypothetical protein ACI789_08275 [Geodermatophilus sp. SYSU D00965]
MPLEGTVFEQVLRAQQVDVRREGDLYRVLVPVTDRGDAIGLIEMLLPRSPTSQEVEQVRSAAHALAYVVIAARRYTDVFEWGQRTTPFSLAVEIQRRLLPSSYTCEAAQSTLADTADLHPWEVVHALGAAVLGATGGDLEDDATMLCLDWYGGPPRPRDSEHGADPARVSPPTTAR